MNVGSNGGQYSTADVPNNPTGVWVGDYTIQPENGGLGVFAHEYGHDLGLPDLYDTSGNTGGAENNTAFWTLMSSGANIGDGSPDGIGDAPTDMSAWELFQLGWLCHRRARRVRSTRWPRPARPPRTPWPRTSRPAPEAPRRCSPCCPTTRSRWPSAPRRPVTYQFWSTQGDNLNTTMTKTGVSGTNLTAAVKYDIETDWDYAFLEASSNGTTWTPVATNRSDTSGDQSGFNTSKTGITGSTGGAVGRPDRDPAGRHHRGAVPLPDRRRLRGAGLPRRRHRRSTARTAIGTAETADEGWAFNGFVRTTGAEVQEFFNAYVSENRQYDGYDESLKTAYNFGFANTKPDYVETHPYMPGMLVWYWNDEYTDNNVGEHPGEGLLLPVDAHPQISRTGRTGR